MIDMHYNIALKQLSLSEMKDIYDKRMKVDFPPDELKKWELIEEIYRKGIYEGLGAFEGDKFIGYAFFSRDLTHRLYLFDYLGIEEELRGQGYGSYVVECITERFKDVDAFVGEVENPFVEDDPTLRRKKQKRMELYLRTGWMDTHIDALMFGVEYRLLYRILGKNNLTTSDIQSAYEKIYRSFLTKEELEPNMWLRKHEDK